MRTIDLHALEEVAAQLDRLEIDYAFTGGIVLGFLLDYPKVVNIRPTDDLDAITAVTSYGQQAELNEKLRSLQFRHDSSEGAPTCRFMYEGVKVDVMPMRDQTGQFDNPWFEIALATSSLPSLEGVTVRTVDALSFIATKLTAFADRGKGDFLGSHDLEDVVTIVDGRAALVDEITNAEVSKRTFISIRFREFLKLESFRDCLPGHLPPDTAGQLRLPLLMQKAQFIADVSE